MQKKHLSNLLNLKLFKVLKKKNHNFTFYYWAIKENIQYVLEADPNEVDKMRKENLEGSDDLIHDEDEQKNAKGKKPCLNLHSQDSMCSSSDDQN